MPKGLVNPHSSGPKTTQPRVLPAKDLAKGDIEVRLSTRDMELLEGQKVTLAITKQSIAKGNSETSLEETTSQSGIVLFPAQQTQTDYSYKVTAAIGDARYSSPSFQFQSTDTGLRVLVPVFKASSDLNSLLILSRSLYAIIPQDNVFMVDVLWRIENYSEVSWLPDGTSFPLPAGAKALTIREAEGDGRFEAAGDTGIKLAGTFSPGQHDLLARFQLPADGKAVRDIAFPTAVHLGTLRVLLDSSPTMSLKVEGCGDPEETRNQDGQRRLIVSRDFLNEKTRAPDKIEVRIAGIPTPATGRPVAVALASVIALAGLVQSVGRRRSTSTARTLLSREDRERASELLLEELIRLEQAFKQGDIGRKTHDQARRQLLEAYARLGAGEQRPEA